MEEDLSKDAGPTRPPRYVAPMEGYEHDFQDEVCTRCHRAFREVYTAICQADAKVSSNI